MNLQKSVLFEEPHYYNGTDTCVLKEHSHGNMSYQNSIYPYNDQTVEFIPLNTIDRMELVKSFPANGTESGLVIHKRQNGNIQDHSTRQIPFGVSLLNTSIAEGVNDEDNPNSSEIFSPGNKELKSKFGNDQTLSNTSNSVRDEAISSTVGRVLTGSFKGDSLNGGGKDTFKFLTWVYVIIQVIDILERVVNTGEKLTHMWNFFSSAIAVDSQATMPATTSLVYHLAYAFLLLILILFK